jgi:exonuclease SbcC
MNPLRLKLRGFIGIRDGLGREELEIDLRHDGASLIALVGHNGAGKTTLLDNMHPYRLMPSRASGYSPKSFSFYDHTFGDALKELDWEYGGTTYRSVIVIKGSGKAKKQECYLQFAKAEADTWKPVSLPDGTVSDGKTDTYDRCVEHILGSPELFFTAAFACQGRKSLADYANADIKALMSDLLGLDHIAALGETSHEVGKGLRAKLDAIRGRADRATQVVEEKARAEQDLIQAQMLEASAREQRDDAQKKATDARRRLAEAQTAHAQAAEVQRRRETLNTQIAAVLERRTVALKHVAQDFQRQRLEKQSALSNAAAARNRARSAVDGARSRITKNEALLARKDEIAEASAKTEAIAVRIAEAEVAVAEAEKSCSEHQSAANTVAQLRTEWKGLKTEHDSTAERCRLIGEVPCQGTDLQGRCKLLAEANAAAASLPAKAEALAATARAGEEAGKRLAALGDPAPTMAQARARLSELRAEQQKAGAVAALQHGIDAATAALEADRAALAAADEQLAQEDRAIGETEAAIAQLDIDLEARNSEIRTLHQTEIDALQRERDALPPVNIEELAAAEQTAADAEAEVVRQDASLTAATAQVATLTERIANLVREAGDLAGDVERARRLEDEIAHWTLLARALGRDGIVALCIDDAGPTLTALANDLLTACYGPRFTVSIETQRETAKGTLAEQFDIKVFDAEQDAVKSIRDTSGGERIWLNECLTRAIALYQAQASGRHYECLFSDESDGALDPEKKRQFMAMKRKVLELGGYRKEFFISHTPDLQAEADAIIDMATLKEAAPTGLALKAA